MRSCWRKSRLWLQWTILLPASSFNCVESLEQNCLQAFPVPQLLVPYHYCYLVLFIWPIFHRSLQTRPTLCRSPKEKPLRIADERFLCPSCHLTKNVKSTEEIYTVLKHWSAKKTTIIAFTKASWEMFTNTAGQKYDDSLWHCSQGDRKGLNKTGGWENISQINPRSPYLTSYLESFRVPAQIENSWLLDLKFVKNCEFYEIFKIRKYSCWHISSNHKFSNLFRGYNCRVGRMGCWWFLQWQSSWGTQWYSKWSVIYCTGQLFDNNW